MGLAYCTHAACSDRIVSEREKSVLHGNALYVCAVTLELQYGFR